MRRGILAGMVLIGLSGGARSGTLACQSTTLVVEETPDTGGTFGSDVALDGDRLIVGSSMDLAGDLGSASIYSWDGESWIREARLTAPAETVYFGSSVDIDGNVAVVNAMYENPADAENPGVVRVYVRDPSGWSLEAELTSPEGCPTCDFGTSVAIDGEVIVVGDPQAHGSRMGSRGSAWVFRRQGTSWTPESRLRVRASDVEMDLVMGRHVDVHRDRVAVSWSETSEAGAVLLYEPAALGWYHVATLTNDGRIDGFGSDFELSDGAIAVGAPTMEAPGRVHVFRQDGADWRQEEVIEATDPAVGAALGDVVALDGNRLLVARRSGDAYLHEWNGSSWVRTRTLSMSDQYTPRAAVALRGSWAAVATPGDQFDRFPRPVSMFALDGPAPREVSAGSSASPLLARRIAGDRVRLSFEDLGAAAAAYHVVEGAVGDFTSHAPVDCGSAWTASSGRRVADLLPDSGSRYFLVAAEWGCAAGPLGHDSDGVETTAPDYGCP